MCVATASDNHIVTGIAEDRRLLIERGADLLGASGPERPVQTGHVGKGVEGPFGRRPADSRDPGESFDHGLDILLEITQSLGFTQVLYAYQPVAPRLPDGQWVPLKLNVRNFPRGWEQGKLVMFDFRPSFTVLYTFWGGIAGGALLAAAAHGTDHVIVQRLLAARGLKDAQRALIGSGAFIIAQFALFLFVGTCLWLAGADHAGMRSDAIYPTFVISQLPTGLAGLVVAGILAAAMSSHASAVNSLASASTHDFYAPLSGRRDPTHLLGVGRWLTLFWTAVLVVGAMAFRDQNTPVVQLALSVASVTYGSLLGTYMLGGAWPRARQRDVIQAIVAAAAVMSPIVFGAVIPRFPWHWLRGLAWPWYVPLGTAVTVAVGMASSLVGQADRRTEGLGGC